MSDRDIVERKAVLANGTGESNRWEQSTIPIPDQPKASARDAVFCYRGLAKFR